MEAAVFPETETEKGGVKKAKNLYLIHHKNLFAIDIHFKIKKTIFHSSVQMNKQKGTRIPPQIKAPFWNLPQTKSMKKQKGWDLREE